MFKKLLFLLSISVFFGASVSSAQTTSSPTITSLSPAIGTTGMQVTIKGTNFSSTGNHIYLTDFEGELENIISDVPSADGVTLQFSIPSVLYKILKKAPCDFDSEDDYTYPICLLNKNNPIPLESGNYLVWVSSSSDFDIVSDPVSLEVKRQGSVPPPTLTAVFPDTGTIGDKITITGTNFAPTGNHVYFYDLLADGFAGDNLNIISGLSSADGVTLQFSIPSVLYRAPCEESWPLCVLNKNQPTPVISGTYGFLVSSSYHSDAVAELPKKIIVTIPDPVTTPSVNPPPENPVTIDTSPTINNQSVPPQGTFTAVCTATPSPTNPDGTYNIGDTVRFSVTTNPASASGSKPYTYRWSGGVSGTASETSVSIKTAGKKNVKVVVTDPTLKGSARRVTASCGITVAKAAKAVKSKPDTDQKKIDAAAKRAETAKNAANAKAEREAATIKRKAEAAEKAATAKANRETATAAKKAESAQKAAAAKTAREAATVARKAAAAEKAAAAKARRDAAAAARAKAAEERRNRNKAGAAVFDSVQTYWDSLWQ